MSPSLGTLARVALLLLLPLVAAAVYMDGQRYDPAVLRFDPSGVAGASALLANQVAGLAMEGSARVYTSDNLFEYVNGHAEFFLSLGFKCLTVAGYSSPDTAPGKPEYTVDVYDMAAPQNAFGALAQESAGMNPMNIGAIGYSSSRSVTFIKDKLYVKVDSFGTGDRLMELAGALAAALPDGEESLPQFAIFPVLGALKSGRFYKREDYMGLELFREVFEQEYEREGLRFYAFAFTPQAPPEDLMRQAMEAISDMGGQAVDVEFGGIRGILVHDEYEGEWALTTIKSKIVGARGFSDPAQLKTFMEELVGKAGG
ncbi:MAG: hypothetical protein OEZ32_05520 [Nitrospinota bacterium]|nr:hypothetical protein [Nitrospinota bacterium]